MPRRQVRLQRRQRRRRGGYVNDTAQTDKRARVTDAPTRELPSSPRPSSSARRARRFCGQANETHNRLLAAAPPPAPPSRLLRVPCRSPCRRRCRWCCCVLCLCSCSVGVTRRLNEIAPCLVVALLRLRARAGAAGRGAAERSSGSACEGKGRSKGLDRTGRWHRGDGLGGEPREQARCKGAARRQARRGGSQRWARARARARARRRRGREGARARGRGAGGP
jgi:hypothetical protein